MTGSKFDTVVAEYAAGRPHYPDALYDEISRLAERPLAGLTAADVGAGTGISARGLRERDVRVIAVDLSVPMLRQLQADSRGVPVLAADAHRLPVRSGSLDLVTYAQSWHWTDPDRSVAEALRVLRPAGALVVWWNLPDRESCAWWAEQRSRIAAVAPDYERDPRSSRDTARFADPRLCLRVAERHIGWSRQVSIETHLLNLRSRSYVAALPEATIRRFLDAERRILADLFPAGELEERYAVRLTVVRRA